MDDIEKEKALQKADKKEREYKNVGESKKRNLTRVVIKEKRKRERRIQRKKRKKTLKMKSGYDTKAKGKAEGNLDGIYIET